MKNGTDRDNKMFQIVSNLTAKDFSNYLEVVTSDKVRDYLEK